jgi:hypothetical protein
MFSTKVLIIYAVAVLYIILILIVLFKIWKVKISLGYQLGILSSTIILAPVGYFWYRWARKEYGVKKRK